MASTDTVVGIVGAVLLAGIMVAVFAYEYANPATPEGPPPDSTHLRQATFAQEFPALNATDDIDGDTVPNYNDTDLDGNGIADANQTTDFRYRHEYTDTSAAPPATTDSTEFTLQVGQGNAGIKAWLNWTVTAPLPQLPTAPNFSYQLMHDGEAVGSVGQVSATGTSRSIPLEVPADQVPGTYTFRVDMTAPGPATPFTVAVVVEYGSSIPVRDDSTAV